MLFMTCSLFESRHWSNQTSKGGKLLVRITDTWSLRNAVFGDILAFFHKIGLRLKLVTENQEGGTNNSKAPAENLQIFRWSQWLFTMSDILELISQRFYIKSFLYPFICSIFLTFWFLYTYYSTCIIYIIWHKYLSHSVFQNTNMFPSWNNKTPQIFVYGSWKLPQNWLMVCSFLFPFAKEAFSGSQQFPSRPSMIRGTDRRTTRLGDIFRNRLGWCSRRSQMFLKIEG